MKKSVGMRGKNRVIAFALLLFIIFSLIWFVLHLNDQPKYGDTGEYIIFSNAEVVSVDLVRTVGYPYVLKAARVLSSEESFRILTYLFQFAFSFASLMFFFWSLRRVYAIKATRFNTYILPAFIASLPLAMHFHVSVLTDSVATSLFIINVTFGLLLLTNNFRGWFVLPLLASIFATGTFRIDRMVIVAVLYLSLLAIFAFKKEFAKVGVAVLVLVTILAAHSFNKTTQTLDWGRPNVSLSYAIFERTTLGRLESQLDDMPQYIRDRVSPEMAKNWDVARGGKEGLPLVKALRNDDSYKALLQASLVSIRNDFSGVVADITKTALDYMLSPFTYAWQTVSGTGSITQYTNSRIYGAHESVSRLYISVGIIVTSLFVLALAFYRKSILAKPATVVYLSYAILLTTLFHASLSGIGFHIRYGLPIYILEFGFLAWVVYVARTSHKKYSMGK